MFIRGLCFVARMNERVEVPKLEFNRTSHPDFFGGIRYRIDDLFPVCDAPLMVVRRLEDKEVIEIKRLSFFHSTNITPQVKKRLCDNLSKYDREDDTQKHDEGRHYFAHNVALS